jgi:hypothetical protein
VSLKLHCDAKDCNETHDIKKGETDLTKWGWKEVIYGNDLRNFHSNKCLKDWVTLRVKEEDKMRRADERRWKKREEQYKKAEAERIAAENKAAMTQPSVREKAQKKPAAKKGKK